ncbi:MAG: DUF3052 domain-containing protein [Bacteroidota bacterium]
MSKPIHTAGYSSTPLAKKLGIKEGYKILLVNAPNHYLGLFNDLPDGLEFVTTEKAGTIDFIHFFCLSHNELQERAVQLKTYLKKTGLLWVSWPKGSSKINTDLKREPIREHLLHIGLVDVKVAAIDKNWSGLKFVYRTKDR